LRDVTPADIVALLADQVPESAQLDYKQALPGDAESERKEFVKDVTAMANTSGGVLLYGITERVEDGQRTGLPEKIVGVGDIASDHEARRLENIVRDRTDPQLTSCAARTFEMPSGETVVAVGVPGSLLAPHAVRSGGTGTYWRRANTSNYAVSASELRGMFLQRATWGEEAEAFRRERIERVRAQQAVPNLDTHGSFFLHVLPLGRLRGLVDIVSHRGELHRLDRPSTLDWNGRANFDGYLLFSQPEGKCQTYAQWFRFGGVEFYCSRFHSTRQSGETLDLDAAWMASDAVSYTQTALKFIAGVLEIDPPYAVLLSLLDLKGGSIETRGWMNVLPLAGPKLNRFDDDVLLVPAAIIESTDAKVKDVLMPFFDMIWQAAGFDDCFLRRAKDPCW
jgi:hypothetical protein